MLRDPIPSPALNLRRQLRLRRTQLFHPRPQPRSIKRVDRKSPITTLRASQPALQPLARAPRRIGQRRVHNLHQLSISRRQLHTAKHTRFAHHRPAILLPRLQFGANLSSATRSVRMPEVHSTVIPALRYRNAPAAIDWLCNVIGFERHAVHEGPAGTIGHAELTIGGGMIMLGSEKGR